MADISSRRQDYGKIRETHGFAIDPKAMVSTAIQGFFDNLANQWSPVLMVKQVPHEPTYQVPETHIWYLLLPKSSFWQIRWSCYGFHVCLVTECIFDDFRSETLDRNRFLGYQYVAYTVSMRYSDHLGNRGKRLLSMPRLLPPAFSPCSLLEMRPRTSFYRESDTAGTLYNKVRGVSICKFHLLYLTVQVLS